MYMYIKNFISLVLYPCSKGEGGIITVVIQVQSRMYGDLPRVNLDNKFISYVNQINLFFMSNYITLSRYAI